MKFIDCSACIGLDTVNRLIINHEDYPVIEKVKQAEFAKDLLEEMDFAGIDEAYVYHSSMYSHHPTRGNEKIIKEVEGNEERLHKTWTILTPLTEPEYTPEIFFPEMKKHNVKALRAFPKRNRYMLDRVSMGEILDVLCEKNIPLYLTPMDNWEHIFAVLKEFPKLTAIITNYGLWGSDRYFFPLLRAYENVYIDTSDYQVLGGFESCYKLFGDERLLFGSNFPCDNYGGPVATLMGADIPMRAKEKIASENIERLMAEVRL